MTPGAPSHHDVLVLGAGNAGTALAAQLLRAGAHDVAVVDPHPDHTYRPLLSYVAAGRAAAAAAVRPRADTLPKGVIWLRSAAVRIDPVERTVELADGRSVEYGDLVVTVGTEPDWDAWPGSRAAYDAGLAASSYVGGTEATAWERLRGLTEGTVVFTLPPEPTSCGPTTLKPLLMACDHWRREGVLGAVRPVLLTAGDPTGVGELEPYVRRALDDYGVEVHTDLQHLEVDVAARRVSATTANGPVELEVDLLHLVPPYRTPEVLAGLVGGPEGLVDNDPRTFRHRTHPQVWALGDCAATLNLHSGAALRKQVPVLVHNLRAARQGRSLQHDAGYSAAPVTVTRDRLCFAEFGPDGERQQAVPLLDLFRPRRSTFLLDRYLLPQLYWHGILRGRL